MKSDFKKFPHIYERKIKNGAGSLICPNDVDSIKLMNTVSNRTAHKNFQMIVTTCNSNVKDDCIKDTLDLTQRYHNMTLQLNFVQKSSSNDKY
mgnify:CR=1 FL=1